MKSWRSSDVYSPIGSRNVLLWDGPSAFTGERVLVIATAKNGNRKVGHMVQIWIIPALEPIVAVQTGRDAAVCGDCKLRGDGHGRQRACYVEWFRAVENIWQARGKARVMSPGAFAQMHPGLQLRIGAYGDPAAVPLSVWLALIETATGWTAYSHAWKTCDQALRSFCMASVDSEAEQLQAWSMGWRTFRVRMPDEDLLLDEIACPASEEAGKRATCATCSLCRGLARPAKSIAIIAHGNGMKWFASRDEAERLAVAR